MQLKCSLLPATCAYLQRRVLVTRMDPDAHEASLLRLRLMGDAALPRASSSAGARAAFRGGPSAS